MPRPDPAPPSARPGGPAIVYLDVTDGLRTGTDHPELLEVVAHLPRRAPGVELVPVVSASSPSGFRRVTPSEMAHLLGRTVTTMRAVDPRPLWLEALAEPSVFIRTDDLAASSEPPVEAALAAIRTR